MYTIAASQGQLLRDKLADTWTWQAYVRPADTLDPIAHAASRSRYPVNLSQTFGRFRVASFGAIDLAVLVRHVDTPLYAMRLS